MSRFEALMTRTDEWIFVWLAVAGSCGLVGHGVVGYGIGGCDLGVINKMTSDEVIHGVTCWFFELGKSGLGDDDYWKMKNGELGRTDDARGGQPLIEIVPCLVMKPERRSGACAGFGLRRR